MNRNMYREQKVAEAEKRRKELGIEKRPTWNFVPGEGKMKPRERKTPLHRASPRMVEK